jgi:hypothetical protein
VDVIALDTLGLERLVGALSSSFEITVSHDRRMVSIPAPHDLSDLAAVTSAVAQTGVSVDEIALRRPTLDDAFMALTGQPSDSASAELQPEEVAS